MKVTVIFLGILKEKAGGGSFEFELPDGATYGDLMKEVGRRFKENFNEQIWDDKANLFKAPIMVVGDKGDFEEPDVPLADGEKIRVVAPLAGG